MTGQPITTTVTAQVPPYITMDEIVTLRSNSNNIQERILNIISKQPGLRICDICKACCGSRNRIAHHVHQLKRQEKIRFIKDGKYIRLYNDGTGSRHAPLFSSKKQEQIYRTLNIVIGLSQDEISRKTGFNQQIVSYSLQKLLKRGIIEFYQEKYIKKYRLK
ncbi:MAG: winged helix-turn-helix domain-containing protein [Candidatus Nanoarchaeia archaeon]|nr:winged helix-turn-helix domain-containing protein [Candidatus Nanoarchaeia archaeon]